MNLALRPEHIDALVDALEKAASNPFLDSPKEFFRNLLLAANLPEGWYGSVAGKLSGDPSADARRLVLWAIYKGEFDDTRPRTTLGALLLAFLKQKPPKDDSRTVVAILVVYGFVPDPTELDGLRARYLIPSIASRAMAFKAVDVSSDHGPDILWRGPEEDLQLQSFFRPEPPWQDVGFLRRAMERAASVCRIEIGRVSGTGFLVAPARVLTNYHVLDDSPSKTPADNLSSTLLRFACYTSSSGESSEGLVFKPIKILEQSPIQELDFVLLEVEDKIRTAQEVQSAPIELKSPGVKTGLNILHHPGGDTMKLSTSSNGVTGVYEDAGLLQYVTPTIEGSSGSPCFNDDWKVVALHHAQRSRPWGSVREGILAKSIHEKIGPYL